jgi:hypothetical protein
MVLKAFLDERPEEVDTFVKKIIYAIGLKSFVSLPLEGDVFKKVIYNSKYLANALKTNLETYNTIEIDPQKGQCLAMFVALANFVPKVFTPEGCVDDGWVWEHENFAGIIKELDAIAQGP